MIPGLGRSPGEGNGNPLQYFCLENPMDEGAWWATVHGFVKSQTERLTFSLFFRLYYVSQLTLRRGDWDFPGGPVDRRDSLLPLQEAQT